MRLAGTAVIRPLALGLPRPWNATSAASRHGQSEFTAMAKAQAGGSGWTALVWSDRLGRLINQWAADHTHALAGGAPILALDMYEHAYHLDFGARAAAYVDAVMGNLHWERIAARYRQVRHGEPEDVALFTPFGAPTQSPRCDLGRRRCGGHATGSAGIGGRLHRSRSAAPNATCCRERRSTIRRDRSLGCDVAAR